MSNKEWAPLSGIQVVDFSAQLPGPLAASVLGDLGAAVIKVEPPGGDFARRMTEAMFQGVNRNKRSLVVDLKHPDSEAVVARLANRADVILESSRPGVAARIGIGPERLRAINPRLVYCSLSGFGQTGPWSGLPGHDLGYLAAAGGMALAGQWSGPPRRSGLPVADLMAGMMAANAVVAAIHERDASGTGRYLDMSLYEAALYSTGVRYGFEVAGPSREHLFPTNDLFEAADGALLALTIIEDHFWDKFSDGVKAFDTRFLAPAFSSSALRRENGDALSHLLRALFKRESGQFWVDLLAPLDVPLKLCVFPAQAVKSPQARERNAIVHVDGLDYTPYPVLADGQYRPTVRTAAPGLGAHSRAVMRELGFAQTQLEAFFDSGVVHEPANPEWKPQ